MMFPYCRRLDSRLRGNDGRGAAADGGRGQWLGMTVEGRRRMAVGGQGVGMMVFLYCRLDSRLRGNDGRGDGPGMTVGGKGRE